MERKKLVTLFTAICLVVTLVLSSIITGCAAPAPAPSPAPAAKPAAPAPTSPAAKPTAAQAERQINILGGPFGTSSYIATFALADLINKRSPWLRATAIESKGPPENIMTLEADPAKKKNFLVLSTGTAAAQARKGTKPFPNKMAIDMRGIATYNMFAPTFITLNPNIKATPEDFLKSKIALSAPLGSDTQMAMTIFEYGWGLSFDKFKVQYMGWDQSAEGLINGLVDLTYAGVNRTGEGKAMATPALQQFMATVKKPVYFLSWDEETLKKTSQGSGIPVYPAPVPAKALGENQTMAYVGFSSFSGWWAYTDMDNDVPYEVSRIIAEYYKDLWPVNVLLTYLTPETMGGLVGSEAELHPGALKLYKEKNIRVGYAAK